MNTIKTGCKEHYQQQQLSKEQLEQLMALQKADTDNNAIKNIIRKSRPYYALAASVIVAVFSFLFFNNNHNELADKVAREIAYNHSKRMELEVTSSELGSVKEQLSELDFNLIESDKTKNEKWQLLGGRYCSIQGKLAAQLRVKQDMSPAYHTYYQAIIPEGFELKDNSYSTWVDGVHVELWVEDGVLLGLAGEE